MDKQKRRLAILVPVGTALLSFVTGGGIATHLIGRENDSNANLIIYFSIIALVLTSFSIIFFGLFMKSVRKDIEANLNKSKAAEDKLRETELEYRQIFDGVNDAIFVESPKGDVLDVNACACEMFGWDREEFLTKNIRDMVPPEFRALLPDEQDESTISEEAFETVNMRANGEYFPVSVTGRMHTVGGKKRLLIVVRDISEQKQAEKKLKMLGRAIEQGQDGMAIVDINGKLTFANQAWADMHGYAVNEILNERLHIFHTEDQLQNEVLPFNKKVLENGAAQEEIGHQRKDGSVFPTWMSVSTLTDSDGQPIGLVASAQDISKRKKAEADIYKLNQATDQSPAAIAITNLNGIIEYVNPAFTRVTGYTFEEALGQNPRVLQSGVHPKEFYADLWNTISSGNTWCGEFCNKNRHGEIFWESASIAPIKDAKGKIINYVAVKEDITEKKKFLVDLEEAKEAAEAAAQAKADFLANMSHEIRTPLNAIYGMTSLMLDTPLNDEQQDFIETIRGGSDTLLKVINDILDYSKIEAGKMELETQPFYVRSCVEEALDLLAEKAAGKMLNLAYIIEDDTPAVVIGDITRLRQILVNLLNNAIKFTDTGEIVIKVKSMLVENNQYELTFGVCDTGIGIPKDKIGKLFKSFSQVDTSTTRKYGGTGLGLAISNQLAKNMGGAMWVESKEGQGSTFFFTILVDADPDAKPVYSMEDIPELSGKKILIVDDNKTNRLILVKQTESWGMKPTAVTSGPEALVLIKEGQIFDIAILDMQMPGIDSFTLSERISETEGYTKLPLIILTSIKRDKMRSSDAHISAFLNKPIKTSSLFNILMGIIDARPHVEQAPKKVLEIDSEMGVRHPLRILLAEDNVINQKVALKLLSRLGYRADLAGNGIEAIQALERQTYDVIFMDIQMPEMDGNEATKRVRERWTQDRQPHIIAMTAHALEGDREKYIARGMDDYVSKPVRVDALIAALEKAKYID